MSERVDSSTPGARLDALDGLIERMAAAQRELSARASVPRHARLRAHVLEQVTEPARSGMRWLAAGVTGSLAAVAIAAVLVFRTTPLSYEVESLRDGGRAQAFLMANDDEPLLMKFSDGSTVELHARARVRVAALHEHGAVLELGAGTIEAALEPGTDASWTVTAGPYRVEIAGTAFVLEWDPARARLVLEVRRGHAMVHGPTIESTRVIDAGERFVTPPELATVATPSPANLPAIETRDTVSTTTLERAAREPTRAAARPRSRPHASAATSSQAHQAAPSEPAATPDWRVLARANQHREALLAAEAAGWEGLLQSLDAEALLDLADTARYAHRSQRATQALFALRERFPGTDAAAKAAFDLGRLEGQRAERCDAAARWFRVYVNERPNGSVVDAARKRIEDCARSHGETASSP